jgi:hypothetical protein
MLLRMHGWRQIWLFKQKIKKVTFSVMKYLNNTHNQYE